MKIIVAGSLGNISKPLTKLLVNEGHNVTVISSDSGKKSAIEAMGATAAIGSMEDAGFLTETFMGGDAVYAMTPLSYTEKYLTKYMRSIAGNYVKALKVAAIKRVVVLSGWAADQVKSGNLEDIFDELQDTSITFLRPGYFYTNFIYSMDMIKAKGFIGKFLTLRYLGLWALLTGKSGLLMGNFGGDDRIVFVAPTDIAEAAAKELLLHHDKTTIRYVGSDEMTCNEAARIIGTAVGRPWLKWVLIPDKDMLQGMKMGKMPDELAETLVEMQSAMHTGKPLENFHRNNPPMGKVKVKDFAKEFAVAYNNQ